MSYRLSNDWRGNRNYQIGSFPPAYGTMHYSIASYCTDKSLDGLSTESNKKSELDGTLTSETYLAQLQSLSNPLQKNLADTLPNMKTDNTKNMTANYRHSRQKSFDFSVQETKAPANVDSRGDYSTLSGIGSFISNVFNVISQVMPFQKRPRRTSIVNLDDSDAPRDSSPPLETWPKSNLDIQNKNKTQSQTHNHTIDINEELYTKMSKECLTAASQCEGKLATVRLLLANKVAATKPVPVKGRRPRRVFVPSNSVEKVFEDAFNPEDCEQLPSSHNLEHVSPTKNVVQHFVKLNCPKVNIQAGLDDKDDKHPKDKEYQIQPIVCDEEIVNEKCNQDLSSKMTINEVANPEILINDEVGIISDEVLTSIVTNTVNLPLIPDASPSIANLSEEPDSLKSEVVASCEDKVNRLKAMLLERKLSTTMKSIKETDKEKPHEQHKKHKTHSKKHKNSNRLTDKRQKCYQDRIIKDDMSFANELDSDIPSSLDNSPQPLEVNKQLCDKNHTIETATSKPSINRDIVENHSKSLTLHDSPIECIFDEVSGRFRNSSTTESEDSFQIVFTDNLQPTSRSRKLSDCDSEDSFIVFEDSPDSCYTSTDIFGNSDEESETSSSDCDSDSGNEVCKLNHAFSRTVSDLTDCSLYEPGGFPEGSVCLDSEDEVDSAVKLGDVIQSDLIVDSATLVKDSAALVDDSVALVDDSIALEDSVAQAEDNAVQDENDGPVVDEEVVPKNTGLLLTDEKKIQKRLEGPKKVRFSQAPPKVHVMRVWQFAARQARAGHWERHALDRERFQRRIADVDMAISWVLKPQHRSRVKFQRFMPWWHAQRRQEAAEKKLREEQEKLQREEEEKLRKEEEERKKEEEEVRKKEEEERMIAEALVRTDSTNPSAEVSSDETLNKDSSSNRDNSIVNDNNIDKKELMVITNKCLLNVDSINEIKMQISNEIKQLLASSDDELKSSSSDTTKRKLSNVKKDKSANKKTATVNNVMNDHTNAPRGIKNVTNDHRNVMNDHKNVTHDHKNVTHDHKNVTSGNKNVTTDHNNVTTVLANCSDIQKKDMVNLPNSKLL